MTGRFDQFVSITAYETLGVSESATEEEINVAYRRAITKNHPDVGGVPRLAQLINDARAVLIEERSAYDMWRVDRLLATDERRASGEESADSWGSAEGSPKPSRPTDPWDDVGSPFAEDPTQDGWRDDDVPSYFRAEDWVSTSPAPNPRPEPVPYAHSSPQQFNPYGQAYPTASSRRSDAPLSSGPFALLVALFMGPLGLWLGIRSMRSWHGFSFTALLAVMIGAVSTLFMGLALLNVMAAALT